LDTSLPTVSEQIRTTLLRAVTADIALGMLLPDQMSALVEELGRVKRGRLLIGNNPDRRDTFRTLENVARTDRAADILEAERFADRRQIQERLAGLRVSLRRLLGHLRQNEADYQAIKNLLALLEKGNIEVHAALRERLPLDLLLSRDSSGRNNALFGAGCLLAPHLSEDIVPWLRSSDATITEPLRAHFEKWWGEAANFRADLVKELSESWACRTTTPYLLYLSVLYRLVSDRITETIEPEEDSWLMGMPPLTDFQQVAVRQALNILNQYNGVFVADVVGLGKTYIGTALLKRLAIQGLRATIFCPPALEPMWKEMNSVYGLSAEVMSTGRLAQYGEAELRQAEYRTQDRQIVLIDESHRFRNPGTESYKVLSNYTQGRSCILLTATPYSLRPRDIYNQMRLFADDDIDLGLDPTRLNDFFTAVDANRASLVEALRPLLIRRTRRHIQKHYPDASITVTRPDGTKTAQKLVFPHREKPEVVRYDVEGVYGQPGQYDYMVRMLGAPVSDDAPVLDFTPNVMTYARYGLYHYLQPAFREKEPYKDLKQAGASVRGFIRILLFKRLESSVHAFRRTVDTLLQVHDGFLAALRQGYVPAGGQAQRLLYEQAWTDESELAEALERSGTKYEREGFDIPRLTKDIEMDSEVLAELKALLAPITPQTDDKLQTLRRLLTGLLRNQKVLLFTQFEATAEYLATHLADLPRTAYLSGRHRSAGKSFLQTLARFAPKANPRFVETLPPDSEPIDILVATDVLSEGLNLQDCSIVINYDLQYNPVRLIQRVGRIDRVGSEADRICLFNFLPERNVEKQLHLEETLKGRIADIHSFIGEDNQILHPDEQLNEQAMYAAYTAAPEAEGDEATAISVDYTEIEERMRALQRDTPDLFHQIQHLPLGVRSARRAPNGERGAFVCFTTDDNFDRFVIVDERGQVQTTRIEDVLSVIECASDEQEQSLPPRYNTLIASAFSDFETAASQRQTDRKLGPRLSTGQQYMLRQLSAIAKGEDNEERRLHFARIEKALRSRLSDAAIRELNRLRRLTLPQDQLLMRLEMLYRDMDLARYSRHEDETPIMPLARIVCSEALIP
jgi:superfamily II DNA or RNA helicase